MRRTLEEVVTEITKFLDGTGGAHDWDDFTSIPINDKQLDMIRIECSDLRDKYPPGRERQFCSDQGIERLKILLGRLTEKSK